MSEIGKKVQDAEVIGHEVVDGNKVPVLKPEVWEKVYCNNCNNEVDSEELATGNCIKGKHQSCSNNNKGI